MCCFSGSGQVGAVLHTASGVDAGGLQSKVAAQSGLTQSSFGVEYWGRSVSRHELTRSFKEFRVDGRRVCGLPHCEVYLLV